MTRAFGKEQDRTLTPTDLAKGIAQLVDYTLQQWQRPTTTLAEMEEQLQRFNEMVNDLESNFPAPALPPFRALIGESQTLLTAEIARKREMPRRKPSQ